jgi:hypothetical protein
MADEPKIETKSEVHWIKLVFVGACVLQDGKKGGIFHIITDEELEKGRLPDTLPREYYYAWSIAKNFGRPGTVYQFQHNPEAEGLSIYANTRCYVGRLKNDPRLVEWQANHDALLYRLDMESREKKEKGINVIQEQLEPVREAYRNMVGKNRTIFLAQIMQYITGR